MTSVNSVYYNLFYFYNNFVCSFFFVEFLFNKFFMYKKKPIGTHGGEVMYFGCVCFRDVLGFLYCDNICICDIVGRWFNNVIIMS